MTTCEFEGCSNSIKARRLCGWHYVLARESDPDRPRCGGDATCGRAAVAKGLCTKHYQQAQRAYVPPSPFCSVDGCERPRKALGLCMRHYDRQRAHGDLAALEDILNCEDCSQPFEKPAFGSRTTCTDCSWLRSRSRAKKTRWRHLLWEKYRIRVNDYFVLLESQGGVCGICGGPPNGQGAINGRFSVDHDHQTGKVRGLLCSPCNSGLGLMRDSVTNLMRAAEYLARHQGD